MSRYLVLLRGINVGGNSIIKMADLRSALGDDGFTDVVTYIQSGNVILSTRARTTAAVAKAVSAGVATHFGLNVETVAFTPAEWRRVLDEAPEWWGTREGWRHYLHVLLPPFDIADVLEQLGYPVADIELTQAGPGVVYSSVDMNNYPQITAAKTAGKPVYKRMTVRNYNTSIRLLALLE